MYYQLYFIAICRCFGAQEFTYPSNESILEFIKTMSKNKKKEIVKFVENIRLQRKMVVEEKKQLSSQLYHEKQICLATISQLSQSMSQLNILEKKLRQLPFGMHKNTEEKWLYMTNPHNNLSPLSIVFIYTAMAIATDASILEKKL